MKPILTITPLLILIGCWQLASAAGLVNEATLPSFTSVVRAWWELANEGQILADVAVSLRRAMVGLAIGTTLGVSAGMAMSQSWVVRELADPILVATFVLPKTAVIPIAVLWFGFGDQSIIFVTALSAVVPTAMSSFHGAASAHVHWIWSARLMGASRAKVLTSVIFPASLVYLLNGIRLAAAFSIIVVISSEMFASTDGIGKAVFVFGESGNYDFMFAAIFTIVTVAFLIDRIFVLLGDVTLRWSDTHIGI